MRAVRGLDLLNVCVAAVQTGFGPFITVFLIEHGWNQTDIGVALSAGTLTAMASQLPAGALVDYIEDKRLAVGGALLAVAAAALLLAGFPHWEAVIGAEVMHGFASCMIAPAIAALTLLLFGEIGFGERLGRNARYLSIGNAAAAAVMGVCGAWSSRAVLVLAASLVAPALAALCFIRPREHAPVEAPPAHPSASEPRRLRPDRPWRIFRIRSLQVFGGCAALFFLGNAAMLPLAANALARDNADIAGPVLSAAIIVPQLVVALVSPWLGKLAETHGRRPVLLLGLAALPLRGLLFAITTDPWLLIPAQVLDGVSGAVFAIMVPLVAADATRRTGSLNLGMAAINFAIGLGASVSTTLSGAIADGFGLRIAFLALSAAGAAAAVLLFVAMPETHPVGPRPRLRPRHSEGR